MKKLLFLLAVPMLAGVVGFANADKDGDGKDGKWKEHGGWMHHGPCGKLNLTAAQKADMKAAFFDFKASKIDLKADLERAKLNYQKLASDPKADASSAQSASQAVSDSKGKLIAAKQSLKTQIIFKILKPDQREAGLQCSNFMERHRHHHHKHWMHEGMRGDKSRMHDEG